MLFLITIFVRLALGAVMVRDSVPEGYTVAPTEWVGPVHPGGANISLQGSIDTILNQLLVQNPTFLTDFNTTNVPSSAEAGTGPGPGPNTLQPRQRNAPSCDVDNNIIHGPAKPDVIISAMHEVDAMPGDCNLPKGPVCTRLTCSWDSAIWWCNDNPEPRGWLCHDFATFVEEILTHCTRSDVWTGAVSGVAYDEQHFNIQVGGASC